MSNTPCIDRLVSELSKLPGIGEKSAQRLSYFIIKSGTNFTSGLLEALSDIENKIKICQTCFSYTEDKQTCKICEDSNRLNNVICVVKNPSDILKIESSGVYRGRYHVLQGVLDSSNMKDDSIRIKELLERMEDVSEVILALDTDFAGDMTSAYIAKLLMKNKTNEHLKITRIARGIPFGSDIEYIDQRTLSGALENRTSL